MRKSMLTSTQDDTNKKTIYLHRWFSQNQTNISLLFFHENVSVIFLSIIWIYRN